MNRWLAATGAAVFLLVAQASGAAAQESFPHCPPGEPPRFVLGFKALHDRLSDTMGSPLECEHTDQTTGDALQQTTRGLAFYRKSTNTPTFTDGWRHWAITARGLVYWTGESIDPTDDAQTVGLTPAELSHRLLKPEDLSNGWFAIDPEEDTLELPPIDFCGVTVEATNLSEAKAGFYQSLFGPYLAQIVAQHPEGEAERYIAELEQAATGCSEWLLQDEDGAMAVARVRPLEIDDPGDEWLAYQLTASIEHFTMEAHVVVLRRENVTSQIVYTTLFGPVDVSHTNAFVQAAEDRLMAQLQQG